MHAGRKVYEAMVRSRGSGCERSYYPVAHTVKQAIDQAQRAAKRDGLTGPHVVTRISLLGEAV